MGFEVAVIGAIGIDTNVYLSGSEIDFSVEATFTEVVDCIGQAGGYVSQSLKRLGHEVCFVGFVGSDYFGDHIRETLSAQGIDIAFLKTDPLGTKRSVNIMYKNGERKNFYDGRGAMALKPDVEAIKKYLFGTKLAHVNIVNWSRFLLKPLREAGLVISVDDVLFFSSTNFRDPTPIISKYLRVRNDRIVICGMGKRGCALGTEHGINFFGPVELDEPVVDTNGAGDSLAAGFLSRLP